VFRTSSLLFAFVLVGVAANPTPRLPDGKPDFGGNGMWNPHYAGNMAETRYHGAPGVDAKVIGSNDSPAPIR